MKTMMIAMALVALLCGCDKPEPTKEAVRHDMMIVTIDAGVRYYENLKTIDATAAGYIVRAAVVDPAGNLVIIFQK